MPQRNEDLEELHRKHEIADWLLERLVRGLGRIDSGEGLDPKAVRLSVVGAGKMDLSVVSRPQVGQARPGPRTRSMESNTRKACQPD
jgi:hypothetical protein